jgi:multidrug efflux pump subunit AcrB
MKSAVEWFSRNHVAANFLMWGILIMGGLSWFNLRKEIFPDLQLNMVSVQVPYPNAAPEEVEKGICIPIEEAVQGVEGIKMVSSIAAEAFGNVMFEIKPGYDVREVMADIKTRVDAIDNFAEEAEKPVVEELLIKNQVLSIAISADTDEATLQSIAEKVRDDLLVYQRPVPENGWERFKKSVHDALAGEAKITQVSIGGTRLYEISIEVSENTLRSHGLTLERVANAVRASSLDLPAGSVRTDAGEVLIRTQAKAYTAPDFAEITVTTRPDGSVVKLRDIAKIKDGFEDKDVSTRFDGRPGMVVNVYRVGDEDTLRLVELVYSYIKESPRFLPEGVKLQVWNDWSLYLRGRMDLMFSNGFQGFVLIVITLGLFLEPRLAWYVSLGIPVSVAGGLLVMPYADVSINMISLFAFILVLGVVVDDAIVIGENVYHRMSMGEPPHLAAPRGTNEVAVIVTFGVLVTVCAFLPMFAVSGVSGKIWRNIPWVVVPVLIISTIESKLILPAHLAQLKLRDRGKMGWLMRTQTRIADGLDRIAENYYRPLVRWCVNWRYTVLFAFLAIFILAIGVVASGMVKFMFFPEVEGDILTAKLKLPEGVPVETTRRAVAQLEEGARRLGEVARAKDGRSVIKHTMATVGDQPFKTSFEMGSLSAGASHVGEVTLELVGGYERDLTCAELVSQWRDLAGPIPGAVELTFKSAMERGGIAIDLELSGESLDELRGASDFIKGELAKFKGVIDISDSDHEGKREIKLNMKPQAEPLGLRLGDVSRQVRQAFYGEEAQRLQRGRDEVKVMVRYPKEERLSIQNLSEMKIRNMDGSEVPFSEVAVADYGRTYSSIKRADRRRAINVTADIDLSIPEANANEVVGELKSKVFPILQRDYPGVLWRFQGEQNDQNESINDLAIGGLLALFGIYVLLAVPLKSYVQPLIVMSVIPFGIVGAVIGHIVMGMNLSIMSMCGTIALSGMVVNESLVLTDRINRFRLQGMELHEAAWRAGISRFRSIMATSVTTFVGLLPIMSETDIQALFLVPMSVALGFGGLFSTFITLLLVPGIYVMLEDARKLLGMGPGVKSGGAEQEAYTMDQAQPVGVG